MDPANGERIRRIVRQHLDSWQRAGLTHLPRSENPGAKISAVAVASPAEAEVPHATPPTPPVSATPSRSVPVTVAAGAAPDTLSPQDATEDSSLMARRSTPEKTPTPVLAPEGASKLSREERQKRLDALARKVAQCTRCPELAATRTQTVFGVGNPEARVLFLGEAPGADEDRQGEPFVGRAGQLLNRIIEACKMKREDIYICNILRCRPPGNRNPLPIEASNCREWLDGQLRLVDPEYIVCWGSVAASNLLGITDPIGRLRGRFFQHGRAKVLCTYHPSYLLRNPAAKKLVWEDMQILMKELGIPLD